MHVFLFTCGCLHDWVYTCKCVCVCVRERERERMQCACMSVVHLWMCASLGGCMCVNVCIAMFVVHLWVWMYVHV